MSQIRVLIADDSPTAVDIIATILETDEDIRIVGKAVNGREAVAMAETLRPDVITVDIQMPIMNGLDAIKQIMAHYPTPILVITSSTDASIAFQALSFGALEVVEKPSLELDFHARKYEEFIRKVKLIARVKVITHISGKMVDVKTVSDTSDFLRVIGIVASTGGPRALASILGSLPKNLSAPVLVVQHIADGFTDGLIQWLADVSPLRVKSAEQGEALARGTVYIAPNGKHLEIGAQNKIVLSEKEDVSGHKPSGSVLLRSLATHAKRHAVGVLLTGMGRDGADGMLAIKQNGGHTIVQDEATSLIFGMPKAAIDIGAAEIVLPVERIAEQITRWTGIKTDA